jgi:glycosyltransferase involved in cell wall biosynthesis
VAEAGLADYFKNADVYLSCALSDGTSVSLLEAMAYGLPVVATDAPGNREWVVPGRGGWLAPPRDARAFADALVEAARLDDASRATVAAQHREIVERRADWDANATRLIEAYDRFEGTHRRS